MTTTAGEDAAAVIRRLGLARHPEGGWFRETFRAAAPSRGRGACTAIYYLLAAGERSAWHRVDAVEIWNWYAGAPLLLSVAVEGQPTREHRLGNALATGEAPQAVVPVGAWQSAASLGAWTLVGCIVAPAFEYAGFELAPPGWDPAGPSSC